MGEGAIKDCILMTLGSLHSELSRRRTERVRRDKKWTGKRTARGPQVCAVCPGVLISRVIGSIATFISEGF